jgi:hypothetical protein
VQFLSQALRPCPLRGTISAQARVAMENESGTGRRSKLRMGAALATVATLVGIATGVLTLRDQIFGDDEPEPPPAGSSAPHEIASFDGVAGNFADSRAILNFMEEHDREPVYLDVGFPDHATGPAGGDNVVSRKEPAESGGTIYRVESVVLITECNADVQIDEFSSPTVADGCQGTSLGIEGPETTDSQTFFEHGVPRIKGHFQVDVTGALYMGISPIMLTPLTEDKARERAL